MNDAAAAATPPATPPPPWEARLPDFQRKLNRFCENWIFAFLVAMAIRHFGIEAFRIPTASMEPMLYGDPGFTKGDHVVVDKLLSRFTGVKRWDVTVFQFPLPEIENGNDARPAVTADDGRLDIPMVRPLMYRNFVKRAVGLPGDELYIANGNIYVRGTDGAFACARKPDSVQRALWQEIYRHGAQAGYAPWEARDGAQLAIEGEAIDVKTGSGSVVFTQPCTNLYIKPGTLRVQPMGQPQLNELVENLSLTTPVFRHAGSGKVGNVWDLQNWEVRRMTSADLDSNSYGTVLNNLMGEAVGDVRLSARIDQLEGRAILCLEQQGARQLQLVLEGSAWRLRLDETVLAEGSAAIVGGRWGIALVDDEVQAWRDDAIVGRAAVAAVDPNVFRMRPAILGGGHVRLGTPSLDRDVHYMRKWLFEDENLQAQQAALADARNRGNPVDIDGKARALKLIASVRAQARGVAVEDLRRSQQSQAMGTGPENAIRIPAGSYLMLGDNSPLSWDSRAWGFVPAENIRGKALAVILPPTRWRIVR